MCIRDSLKRHVENIRKFGIPAVVAINEFVSDTEAEIAALKELCASIDVPVELASVWADGAEGGVALAETLVKTISCLLYTSIIMSLNLLI